jgi:hypothetical protein
MIIELGTVSAETKGIKPVSFEFINNVLSPGTP